MSYSSEVLADSPLGYWRLGDTSGTTMTDSSGNGRDGSYSNVNLNQSSLLLTDSANKAVGFGVTGATWRYGLVADAAWLDSSSFTVECWFTATTTSSYQGLVTRDGVPGSRGWNLYLLNGQLHLFDAAGSGAILTGSTTVSTNTTYHAVLTSNGSTVKLYLNGAQDATGSYALGNSLANNIMVGASVAGNGEPTSPALGLSGVIDEVAYYGTALSATRVGDHYTAGTTTPAITITHNANVPGVTSSATLLNTVAVTHSANVPGVTSSMSLDVADPTRTITHNANVPGVTSSFSMDVVNHLTHVANVPGVTSTATLLTSLTLAHAANVPGVTSSFSLSVGALLVTHDANVPAVRSAFTVHVELGYLPGDTSDLSDGLILGGSAVVTWTPTVVDPPTGPPGGGVGGGGVGDIYGAQEVVAQAFPLPTLTGAHATLDVTYKREPRLRQRVVIHGQDVTYFRGYATVIEQLSYREPFLYGSAVIRFPQLVAPFAEMEQADNSWNAPERIVAIETIDAAGNVDSVDFKGRVSDINYQGTDTVLMVAGEVVGPADTRDKQLPLVPYRHDAGRFIVRMLNNLGVDARPLLGVDTGYILGEPGPGKMLEILDEMHAQAWTEAGRQWTTMPDADGVYRTFLKDNTTVHASAYPDGSRVVIDLTRSITDEHNRVFGRGVRKDGMVINNGVYGGMIEGDVPAFPGTMSSGDSGDDVQVLIHRLRVCRYMNADEAAGGYDADVVEAVQELQKDAGLSQTGVVNNATWRALWDLDITGSSVRGAQIVPLAQEDYTREWFHSGGGAFTGLNPDYDPTRQIVDLSIDFGANQRRNQMRRRARAELANAGPHYTGTITLTEGALPAGDHTPGDPITTIIHDRELRPGMNIKLPTMLGDRLLHISGIDRRGRETTLAVDTKFRDAVPVWKIHERNRENRQNLNRWGRGARSSGLARDSIGEWSEVGGLNDRRRPLVPGEWIVFQVISGPSQGTIRDFEISCGSGVEFAVAVFGAFVNPAMLNNWVPNPLTEAGYERWKDPDIRAKLREHNIRYSAGVEDDPCGYWPDKKSEGASIITGDWFDEGSWGYSTEPPLQSALVGDEPLNNFGKPVLYVCVYANAGGYVRAGRMFKPQGESGV